MGWYGLFLATLLGLAFGSFAGVLLERLPRRQSILWPRSRCGICNHTLSPLELVPVASYLLLRGRCRVCASRIPPRDLLMELHAGGLTAVAFLLWGWLGALFSLGVFVIVSIGVALGRRAHRRSQAGFTLVEAVISVGLVTLVLIPVIRLFLIGFAVHSSANTRMVMVNLIREKLDGVQASVVNGHLPTDQDWHCVNPDGTADLQWKRTIEPWGKEGWEKADDPGRLYKVTVEVRKNPCEKAIDPTKPPPPADEGWAVVRFG